MTATKTPSHTKHRILIVDDHPVFRHGPVSYTHLRAHETVLDLVCRLLLEKKQQKKTNTHNILLPNNI